MITIALDEQGDFEDIDGRNPPKVGPMVDGVMGFLFFDKDGSICYSLHWEHYFNHILDKYNCIYKVQLPKITPHVCRHIYCSNMAKFGMNTKTLLSYRTCGYRSNT